MPDVARSRAGRLHPETRERLPATLSFWVPGLGQLVRREWGKGLALLAGSWAASDQVLVRACSETPCAAFAAWVAAAVAIWLMAVADAYRPRAGTP